MKWLFVLLLALAIFGSAAWFGYNTFVKEEIEVKKEQRGEVTPPPVVDVSLPEFQAAVKLREDGKLAEARDALMALIQKYPAGKHLDEARDLLGEVNVANFAFAFSLSGKNRIHRETGRCAGENSAQAEDDAGDDHAHEQHEPHDAADWRPVAYFKSRFLDGHPTQVEPDCAVESWWSFSSNTTSARQSCRRNHPSKITTKVAETMAWKGGQRVGLGSKDYLASTKWIRFAGAPAYTLYSVSDSAHPNLEQPPPPTGLGLAATDLEELSTLVNNRTPVTIVD